MKKHSIQLKIQTVIFIIAFLLCNVTALFASENKSEEEVDYVALAAILIKDGYYDRAENAILKVNTETKDLDLVRFHTLKGLIFLNKKEFKIAKDSFLKAIKAGQTETVIYLYLAQTEYGLKEYTNAIQSIKKAGNQIQSSVNAFILLASCYWNLHEPSNSFETLIQAEKLFPTEKKIKRTRIFFLVELGLFQRASELGQDYIKNNIIKEDDFIAIGEALINGNALEKAILFMEKAKLSFPESKSITLLLAKVYLLEKKPLVAVSLIEKFAYTNQELTVEVAELYLKMGKIQQAKFWNTRIKDQKIKIKQRLAIILSEENFELAASMETRLSRLDLLSDEDIRYALAYSLFKTGHFDKAKKHLLHLKRADLFKNANELRKAMEICTNSPYMCAN